MTTRINVDPASLEHGAVQAAALSKALEQAAHRLAAMPHPEGTPPEVGGQLRAAAAALGGPSRSLARQVMWLRIRALAARYAGGPLGAIFSALCGALLAPDSNPFVGVKGNANGKVNYPGPDFLWKAGKGVVDTVSDVGKNAGLFVYGVGAGAVDMVTGLVKLSEVGISGLTGVSLYPKWEREYGEGLDWAYHHPLDFAEALGKSTVQYDEYKKHNYAYAAGRNVFDIASLFVGVGELGAAGKAGHAAALMPKAAKVEQAARYAHSAADLDVTLGRIRGDVDLPRVEVREVEAREAHEAARQAVDRLDGDLQRGGQAARDAVQRAQTKQPLINLGTSLLQNLGKEPWNHDAAHQHSAHGKR